MAIKASGSSLAFSEIRTFWGGSGAMSLSDYYAGGSNVFSGAEDEAGNAIPSSSTIKVSDFYSTHTVTTGATTDFECTTSFGIPVATAHTYSVPLGVSTLTCTIIAGGGSGGEGDESGVGGGGGGGGSGGVVQGVLTISNNVQGNPTQQSVFLGVGAGGTSVGSGSGGDPDKSNGNTSQLKYPGNVSGLTQAGNGGFGGGFSNDGSSYQATVFGSGGGGTQNIIASAGTFSASINVDGTQGDGPQAASGDSGSIAGTAGKTIPSNPLSITSTGGAAGTLASNSAATGGNASGFGAGGGGAASIDRTGDHHWYGGRGAPGFIRIVVTS